MFYKLTLYLQLISNKFTRPYTQFCISSDCIFNFFAAVLYIFRLAPFCKKSIANLQKSIMTAIIKVFVSCYIYCFKQLSLPWGD